ncbi:hypothetical protein BKA62DRAFT_722418 [Auriculariales sp. MPI-PUGE-AT-0066]|nr:hypothetical protein BKA62DRAFT_722418 [Auriculariales sp. MPI-PUGE-AT-0066]
MQHSGRTTPPLCFARLPQELILHIFECAANGDRSVALDLCLVNRDISRVVRPIIYRTVTLMSARQTDQFLFTLRFANKEFIGTTVQNLYIADGVLEQFIRSSDAALSAMWRITHECTGLKRIIAPVVYIARLVSRAEDQDIVLPCSLNLEHLTMVVSGESFPVLTHLAVLHIQFTDRENALKSDTTLAGRLLGALELPALRRLMVCCNGLEPPDILSSKLAELRDHRIRVVMGYGDGGEVLRASMRGDGWWQEGIPVYFGPPKVVLRSAD